MMKNIRWQEIHEKWLLDNYKNMEKGDLCKLFMQTFPDFEVTEGAIKSKCSRIGAVKVHSPHPSTKILPLYSIHKKKNHSYIKVALPSVYWSIAKWVYLEYHPWEYPTISDDDVFYYADGNKDNLHPDNILRVKIQEATMFMQEGGIVKGNPEQTRINLARTRLKIAQLNAGEKLGLVTTHGKSRCFKTDRNRKAVEYRNRKIKDPEYVKEERRKARERYKRLASDPEWREKRNAYNRKWQKEYRAKKLHT